LGGLVVLSGVVVPSPPPGSSRALLQPSFLQILIEVNKGRNVFISFIVLLMSNQ